MTYFRKLLFALKFKKAKAWLAIIETSKAKWHRSDVYCKKYYVKFDKINWKTLAKTSATSLKREGIAVSFL